MKKTPLRHLARLMDYPMQSDAVVSGVSVDSRLLQPGELFFALPGERVDGHAFLADAAAKGASAAVVSKEYSGPNHNLTLVRVDNPLKVLQKLAKENLAPYNGKIVAVTGSLGKTTTKEFITTILKTKYRVTVSPGNSNSQIGLPLTILNHVQGNEDVLIFEMGMTHSGQISQLLQIASPDIAVITTVALVHAGNFASLEDIARSKAEILAHPKTALGIVPRELPIYDEVMQSGTSCYKMSFSISRRDANYYLEESHGFLRIYDREGVVTIPSLSPPGSHNRHNLLAAIAVARNLGLNWKLIQKAIPLLTLPERRFQQLERLGVMFVNDSYNASEQSIKAALSILPAPKPGKKRIAIIGEIVELGRFSEGCHHAVGEASLQSVDSMICLGQGCRPIVDCWQQAARPVTLCTSIDEVVKVLKQQVEPGDVVLLKGSRKNNLWTVLNAFEERMRDEG